MVRVLSIREILGVIPTPSEAIPPLRGCANATKHGPHSQRYAEKAPFDEDSLPKFGNPSQADDGCQLDGKWERIVHDTIRATGLDHLTHPSLADGKGGKADFLVSGVYVEVWGLESDSYEIRRSEKLAFYLLKKLPLVEFEPSDFAGKAKTIRGKIQEILRKSPTRQEKLRGIDVPATRDLRLDEYAIAESLARAEGELDEIDLRIEQAASRLGQARE